MARHGDCCDCSPVRPPDVGRSIPEQLATSSISSTGMPDCNHTPHTSGFGLQAVFDTLSGCVIQVRGENGGRPDDGPLRLRVGPVVRSRPREYPPRRGRHVSARLTHRDGCGFRQYPWVGIDSERVSEWRTPNASRHLKRPAASNTGSVVHSSTGTGNEPVGRRPRLRPALPSVPVHCPRNPRLPPRGLPDGYGCPEPPPRHPLDAFFTDEPAPGRVRHAGSLFVPSDPAYGDILQYSRSAVSAHVCRGGGHTPG